MRVDDWELEKDFCMSLKTGINFIRKGWSWHRSVGGPGILPIMLIVMIRINEKCPVIICLGSCDFGRRGATCLY